MPRELVTVPVRTRHRPTRSLAVALRDQLVTTTARLDVARAALVDVEAATLLDDAVTRAHEALSTL